MPQQIDPASKLFIIDQETGDIKESAKRKLGDYLSRRTKAVEESPVRESADTFVYQTGAPDENTYTPPNSNAYPIASSNEDQKKFAKEYQTSRWSYPETLPITRHFMKIGKEGENEEIRARRNEMLKDVLTIQDAIPDPVEAVTAIQNGESILPNINPVSLAMQAEIQLKLSKNRFTKNINPVEKPERISQFGALDEQKVKSDASSWISRGKAYRGLSQRTMSHRLAAELAPAYISEGFKFARKKYNNDAESAIGDLSSKLADSSHNPEKMTVNDIGEIEDRLDSQYMPFYFHDLRTNEMLNFHAFVSNIQDSYTAGWDEVSGYGRLDAVQVYKGATRNIGLDFYVVSTSEKDFDRMWWTINRLVMMIYPQWSEGDKIGVKKSDVSYNVIQPFSQVITSSPIIRLRVGDLIASNYSRFNLARIFGMGLAEVFTIPEEGKTIFVTDDSGRNEFIQQDDKLAAYISNLPHSSFSTSGENIEPLLVSKKNTENIKVIFAGTVTIDQGSGFINPLAGLNSKVAIPRGTKGTVISGRKKRDGTIVVLVKLDQQNKISINTITSNAVDAINGNKSPSIEYVAVNPESLYYVFDQLSGPKSVVRQEDIDEQRQEIASLREREEQENIAINDAARSLGANPSQQDLEEISNRRESLNNTLRDEISTREDQIDDANLVMQREAALRNEITNPVEGQFGGISSERLASSANSIVRSFEDSYGRGLAGVIKSINFDWNEASWETSMGSRGPMWCKVSIQFTPIHDIPMGLDSEGMPRAVPYPVGNTTRAAHFPELHKKSSDSAVRQINDSTKLSENIANYAEEEINKYLGRSIKRIL